MPWNYAEAKNRIRQSIIDASLVKAQNFATEYYPTFITEENLRRQRKEISQKPLFGLTGKNPVMVETIQIYVNITNYDEYRLQDGAENEVTHQRALQFLHLHYSACDRIVENTNAQRIDFHSARMHAVILESQETGISRSSLIEALELANQLRMLSNLANQELANNQLGAHFRIGIDAGPCVAINSGNGKDKEPLFLGSAANHAAKLAEGDVPGIFLSDRVRTVLGLSAVGSLDLERLTVLEENYYRDNLRPGSFTDTAGQIKTAEERTQSLLAEWKGDILAKKVVPISNPSFTFHRMEPPLSKIEYSKLSPSNSIRMDMASLFADLDGYTAYIDEAMRKGDVSEAVRAIFVIRGELQTVLERDFGGRKVRFIGDCIHGVIAEGTSESVDLEKTVRSTAECAGALRSSFDICKKELRNIDNLGLAIGAELGETPITRIGIRGERGVRIASSLATTGSENLQGSCNGSQTRFGAKALRNLPFGLHDQFDDSGFSNDMQYDDVAATIVGQSSTTKTSTTPVHRSHSVAIKK